MNYLTKFDSNGKRLTSYPLDQTITEDKYAELINDGFIEIAEEEWNYYVGNMGTGDNGTGYIYDSVTGKPVSAPAHVPSKEEKLAALDSQYDGDKAELTKYFTDALFAGDTDAQEELKAEMAELDLQYAEQRKEIEEG